MSGTPRTADRSGLLELPLGRVYVQDVGPVDADRPPLVLVHGFLVTHYEFRKIVPLLAGSRRVIALDLPGAGESDRPEPVGDAYTFPWLARAVAHVLDALGLDVVDVLGHSVGGTVSLYLVDAAPERVRRLVLVDPICFTMDLPTEGKLALTPMLGPLLFKRLYRRAELHRHMERAFSTPELVEEAAVDLYWDRLAREGGRDAAHAVLHALANLDDLRDRLRRVGCPTLVVWGDRDHIAPVELADKVVELIPRAELRIIEGCGHAANEERPEPLVELVRAHLDRP